MAWTIRRRSATNREDTLNVLLPLGYWIGKQKGNTPILSHLPCGRWWKRCVFKFLDWEFVLCRPFLKKGDELLKALKQKTYLQEPGDASISKYRLNQCLYHDRLKKKWHSTTGAIGSMVSICKRSVRSECDKAERSTRGFFARVNQTIDCRKTHVSQKAGRTTLNLNAGVNVKQSYFVGVLTWASIRPLPEPWKARA